MSLATTSMLRSCAVGSTPSSSGGSYSFVHGDLAKARGEQRGGGRGDSELGDQGSGTSALRLTCTSRHRGCSRRASRHSPLRPWPAAGAGRPCSAGRRSDPARGRPALCSMAGGQLVTSGGATHECGAVLGPAACVLHVLLVELGAAAHPPATTPSATVASAALGRARPVA